MNNPAGWGQKLLAALEQTVDPKRLGRGRQYIASHKVPDWTVDENRIHFSGRNRGTAYYGMNEPIRFEGRISISRLPETAWDAVIAYMGDRASFIVRLLLNEIPDSIDIPLQALGHRLIPGRYGDDLWAECSCPEPEPPCRHIAAVLIALAARLDQTPELLFELRGLNRQRLAQRLENTTLGSILTQAMADESDRLLPVDSYFTRPEPLPMTEASVDPREFWRSPRKLPANPEPPQAPPVPGLLIKKGGDYPPFWQKEISFIEVMDIFYEEVRRKAKDWS